MSKWKKVALWKKILIGVVIGLIICLVSPKAAEVISPLGDIFLRMLKMLIVPLVFFSITSGVCKMGDVKQLRTVGIRYVLWIIASAVIAAICGVIGGLIVQPGRGTTEFLATAEAAEAQSYSFIDNVISWFPTNIVESMANANMLQIIVFCLFLGVALLALGDKAKTVIRFIDEGSEVMLKITEYVIEFSPFGILSLIATMVSTISGAMIMAKATASSPMPNTAPPKEKRINSTGINKTSLPRVWRMSARMPLSMVPVRITMPNAPPMTSINIMMPTAVPNFEPEVKPSNGKFIRPGRSSPVVKNLTG